MSSEKVNIFEPGDLEAFLVWHRAYMKNYGSTGLATGEYLAEQAWKAALNFAEQQLSSLGIDAETPGKVKALQARLHLESRMPDGVAYQLMRARLSELERMIAEAPYAYMAKGYGHYDKWSTSYSDLDANPTHRARLVQIESLTK